MQYSQIATSMSPKFMQKIVQNADAADPVSGLSGSKIAHHTASPITIIKQPRPCTMQLHSVNPTTCMQTRFKFHGIGVAMMHTARATPAGARSIAAQHTRAEMQQLCPQSHCKQHRCNHNGCSLIATSMQLRLYHCYNCNVVHTALATIATATVTTDANIAPATATILQVQPQLQPHCCANIATATTTAPATTMQSLQLQTQSELKY